MKNNPLVTVNILSFNRKDELHFTLTKVFEQDYKNIEVIVVDNASSDGTQQMVKTDFPIVNLIELKKNIGIAGWNKGFEIAKGEYVLVLDDDSYPENGTIKNGIEEIKKDNNIAIIAFNVINRIMKQSQTEIYKRDCIEFIGCGAIIREKTINKIGGFDPEIFIYGHERDFSIRILNENYKILYLKDSIIYHMPMMKDRSHPIFNEFRIFHSTISTIIVLRKYLFPFSLLKYKKTISKLIINRILLLLYFFKFRVLIDILKYILKGKHKIGSYDKKISNIILERYDYFNMPFFDNQYFPRKKSINKIYIIIYYILTFFSPYSKKIKKIRY